MGTHQDRAAPSKQPPEPSDRRYRIRSVPLLRVARELGFGEQRCLTGSPRSSTHRVYWFSHRERMAAIQELERRGLPTEEPAR